MVAEEFNIEKYENLKRQIELMGLRKKQKNKLLAQGLATFSTQRAGWIHVSMSNIKRFREPKIFK